MEPDLEAQRRVVGPAREASAERIARGKRALRVRLEELIPPDAPERVPALGIVVAADGVIEGGDAPAPVGELDVRDAPRARPGLGCRVAAFALRGRRHQCSRVIDEMEPPVLSHYAGAREQICCSTSRLGVAGVPEGVAGPYGRVMRAKILTVARLVLSKSSKPTWLPLSTRPSGRGWASPGGMSAELAP
jgi:hypothetical protein